ncbi:hypothetical protein [Vibrio phage vB_VmeM-Yong XC32]|nr:hypothetical protein [Vibrio phage vB_VmeM-Yong XC31]QAX96573.1 hypothetical protein [Vibrio phage vB_VmeM-Yong XC32]QAX96891.1 hypothetical protein [Vibrio phage vB_VmeM-Yong MS31]QAX97196.1 hypothetical protein [Vibrio phage vB_VmeM-Yong MS32]
MTFKSETAERQVSVVDAADYNLDAQASAMLSALCSRSQEGPKGNLAKVMAEGPERFMKSIYLGYGHESVGKQGHTKVFVSGVSMIAINELQNLNPLYKGTEASTRYIPFEAEGVYLPETMERFRPLIEETMSVYEIIQPMVFDHLKATLTKPEGVSDKKWDATLNARKFDICRSLLPAGCKTVGVWDVDLQNASYVLRVLWGHPNEEVRLMARDMHASLCERYPESFTSLTDDIAMWASMQHRANHQMMPSAAVPPTHRDAIGQVHMDSRLLDSVGIQQWARHLAERPKYAPLADYLGNFGRLKFNYNVDFGGYRDLNRHRKGNTSRSPLGTQIGFEPWYLEQMPEEARSIVEALLDKIHKTYMDLTVHGWGDNEHWDWEYIIPMGYRVATETSYPIDNAVYTAELRSGPTVHPTVRRIAQDMLNKMETLNLGFKLHGYRDEIDKLDVRRADQTICLKEDK